MSEKEPAPRQTVLPEISLGLGTLNDAVAAFVESCPAVVVVHDGCLAPVCLSRIGELSPSATLLDVRRSQPGALDGLASDTGILYACLRDDLGLPFVDRAYARRLRVQPV